MNITYDQKDLPEEWVLVLDDTEVQSDHSFFIRNNIPAVWFRGLHEYPKDTGDLNERNFKHTPVDSLETMEFYSGGKSELLNGIDTGLSIAFELANGVLELVHQEYLADTEIAGLREYPDRTDFNASFCLFSVVITAVVLISGYLYWKRKKKG
jgi:hypothetical protein